LGPVLDVWCGPALVCEYFEDYYPTLHLWCNSGNVRHFRS